MDFICEQGHIFELLVCLNVRRFGISVLFAFHSELVSECKAWHDKEILAALIALAVVLPLPPVTVKKNLNPLRDPTGTQTRSVGKVTSISNAVTARAPWPPLKKDSSHPEGVKKLGQSLHRDCPIRAHHWQKHGRPIACVLPGARAGQNGLAGTVDSARCAKER